MYTPKHFEQPNMHAAQAVIRDNPFALICIVNGMGALDLVHIPKRVDVRAKQVANHCKRIGRIGLRPGYMVALVKLMENDAVQAEMIDHRCKLVV